MYQVIKCLIGFNEGNLFTHLVNCNILFYDKINFQTAQLQVYVHACKYFFTKYMISCLIIIHKKIA